MSASIYISGLEQSEYCNISEGVNSAIELLKDKGVSVINPYDMPFSKMSWSDTLQSRLSELCKCDAIVMMPFWKEDILSRIELTAAMDMHLHTFFYPIEESEVQELITALDV